jgi:hypothetical protein
MHNTVTQGLFDPAPRPNTGTTSSIGEHVSEVGVPQNAQDLTTYKYQLVLHSIKQDLSAVLQRRANTPLNVDWEQLMHHEAPEEPRNILQGLVYVAKIKDVANTRGGAQVSQHRRVLAQQTYNMLVQELSDVLQGEEVQRRLRDLSARANLDAERNKTFDPMQVSTSQSGNTRITLNNDDTDASVNGYSRIDEIVQEMLQELDVHDFDGQVLQDISNARKNDETNTQKKLETLKTQNLELSADAQLKEKIHLTIDVLETIQRYRTREFERYDAGVKQYKNAVTLLEKKIIHLRSLTTQSKSDQDQNILQLDSQSKTIREEYKCLVQQTQQKLAELKDFEENVGIDDGQVHRDNIEISSTRENDGNIIQAIMQNLIKKHNELYGKDQNMADEINEMITRLEQIRVFRERQLKIYDESVAEYINALTHFKEKVVNLLGHKSQVSHNDKPTIQESHLTITQRYELYEKEVKKTKEELAKMKNSTEEQIQKVQQLET